jgi:hypothetical protein
MAAASVNPLPGCPPHIAIGLGAGIVRQRARHGFRHICNQGAPSTRAFPRPPTGGGWRGDAAILLFRAPRWGGLRKGMAARLEWAAETAGG